MCMPCYTHARCVCVACMCAVCMHMCTHECKKRALDSPELEQQAIMSLTWTLGTKLESSGKAASIQNH